MRKPLTDAGHAYEIADLLSLIGRGAESPTPAPDTQRVARMALAGLWALGKVAASDREVFTSSIASADVSTAGVLLANIWRAIARESLPSSQAVVGSLLRAAQSSELAGMPALSGALADSIASAQLPAMEKVLVALLQKRILLCRNVASQNLELLLDKRRSDDDVAYQPWWQGEAKCFSGIVTFADAMLRGKSRDVESAFAAVDEGHALLEDGGFVRLSNQSLALAQVMRTIWGSSTWKCLETQHLASPVWKRYLSLLARGALSDSGARGILELWNSQKEAIQRGLLGTGDIVVRVPTGAGKTLAAELAVVAGFARKSDSKCLYVAPFRALADEVQHSLENHLEALGYLVSEDLGPEEFPSPLNFVATRNTDVLVTTPERARMLLSIDPSFFRETSTVVLDELHLATDHNGSRGGLYEALAARLTRKCPNARFVGLSAVLSGTTSVDMSAWLSNQHSETGTVAVSSWRPTQREILECWWPKAATEGQLKLWQGDSDTVERSIPEALGSIRPAPHDSKPTGFHGTKADICAQLVSIFAKKGPVLVYCPQKNEVKWVAESLQRLLSLDNSNLACDLPPSDGLRKSFEEWQGSVSEELKWLDMGFATHHAGLPQSLRAAVEEDFRNGRLKCLIATGTLSAGVNLPFSTIVFHSVYRHDDVQGWMRRIFPEEFWNAAGRAGRPGKADPGRVIFVARKSKDHGDLDFFLKNRDDALLPLKSQLYRALITKDYGQVFDTLDHETVAILADPVDSQQPAEAIAGMWASTLANIEARKSCTSPEPILIAIEKMRQDLVAANVTQDIATVWSQTGLSTQSCSQLSEASQNPKIQEIFKAEGGQSVESVLELMLPICLDTQECHLSTRERDFVLATAPYWVQGADTSRLLESAELLYGLDAERTLRLLFDTLQSRLPWVLSGLVTICARNLGFALELLPESLCYLPSMVRLGLPSPDCCRLASAGIGSRRLVIALEEAHAADRSSPSLDVLEWLASPSGYESAVALGLSDDDWHVLTRRRNLAQIRVLRLAQGQSDYLPWPCIFDVDSRTGSILRKAFLMPGSPCLLRRLLDGTARRSDIGLTYKDIEIGRVPDPVAKLLALDLDIGNAVEVRCTGIAPWADEPISQVSVLLLRSVAGAT